MTKLDKSLLLILATSSLFMFYNLYLVDIFIGLPLILPRVMTVIFYVFGLITPIYMLIRWLRYKKKQYFNWTIITSVPGFIFAIWFLLTLKALGEALSQF